MKHSAHGSARPADGSPKSNKSIKLSYSNSGSKNHRSFDKSAADSELKAFINQWKAGYIELESLLKAEQNALENRNFEELGDITNKKNECVASINQIKRPESIGHTSASLSSSDLLSSIQQSCSKNSALSLSWHELLSLIDQCQFQNEVNGRLLGLLESSCKRVFNLMKGMDPDNNIYNSSGACSRVESSRASVSA